MNAYKLSFYIHFILVDRTVGKSMLRIVFHVILVLKLGYRSNQHHIGRLTKKQAANCCRLKYQVGFKQQEIIISQNLTGIVQRIHTVCFSIKRAETGFYHGILFLQFIVYLTSISRADYDALYAAREQGLYAAKYHRLAADRDKSFGYKVCVVAEAGSHACGHYHCCLNHLYEILNL
jgi:hypothetical protein